MGDRDMAKVKESGHAVGATTPAALHTVKPVVLRQVWCMGMDVLLWIRRVVMDKGSLGKEQGRVKFFREKRGQAAGPGAGRA